VAVTNLLTAMTIASYGYDGEGRRVQKVSGTTTYLYDAQGQLAAEYITGVAPQPKPQVTSKICYTDESGKQVCQQ